MKNNEMVWGKYSRPATKEFGKLLAFWRKKAGLSAKAFASAIGLEASNYPKIESGLMQPRRYTAVEINLIWQLTGMSRSQMLELLALWNISRGEIPKNLDDKDLEKIKKCFIKILKGK